MHLLGVCTLLLCWACIKMLNQLVRTFVLEASPLPPAPFWLASWLACWLPCWLACWLTGFLRQNQSLLHITESVSGMHQIIVGLHQDVPRMQKIVDGMQHSVVGMQQNVVWKQQSNRTSPRWARSLFNVSWMHKIVTRT